jgi:hypothetical protein
MYIEGIPYFVGEGLAPPVYILPQSKRAGQATAPTMYIAVAPFIFGTPYEET